MIFKTRRTLELPFQLLHLKVMFTRGEHILKLKVLTKRFLDILKATVELHQLTDHAVLELLAATQPPSGIHSPGKQISFLI